MAYKQITDGEMVEVTDNMVLDVACCDCGLIHRIEFSSPTTLRWSLRPEATKQYRKRHKLPYVPREK